MATSKPKAPPKAPAVLKPTSGSLASPSAMEMLKAHAARGMAQLGKLPSSTGVGISFRGGTIAVGGTKVGNTMRVIPLFPQYERAFYSREFSAEDKSPPDCYSYDGVAPHEKSVEPQNATCAGCPMNEWKSDRRGKGKACKEGSRLALLRYDGLTPESVASAPILMAKFSVMNSKVVGPAVQKLFETAGHCAGVVCDLTCEPDDAIQIANDLLPVMPVPEALQQGVIGRLEEAEKLATVPYPEPEAGAVKAPAKKATKAVRKF